MKFYSVQEFWSKYISPVLINLGPNSKNPLLRTDELNHWLPTSTATLLFLQFNAAKFAC